MHGSNRLGGNSLSDLLVFGRIAGLHAAKYATSASMPDVEDAQLEQTAREALEPFDRAEGTNPFAVHEDLKEQMQKYIGIMRNAEDPGEVVSEQIERLWDATRRIKVEGPRHYNAGWHEAIDMRNMMIVSEAMARAAQARKESRGAHARDDFSEMDKTHWGKVNLVLKKGANGMEMREVDVPPPPDEIKKVLEEE